MDLIPLPSSGERTTLSYYDGRVQDFSPYIIAFASSTFIFTFWESTVYFSALRGNQSKVKAFVSIICYLEAFHLIFACIGGAYYLKHPEVMFSDDLPIHWTIKSIFFLTNLIVLIVQLLILHAANLMSEGSSKFAKGIFLFVIGWFVWSCYWIFMGQNQYATIGSYFRGALGGNLATNPINLPLGFSLLFHLRDCRAKFPPSTGLTASFVTMALLLVSLLGGLKPFAFLFIDDKELKYTNFASAIFDLGLYEFVGNLYPIILMLALRIYSSPYITLYSRVAPMIDPEDAGSVQDGETEIDERRALLGQ